MEKVDVSVFLDCSFDFFSFNFDLLSQVAARSHRIIEVPGAHHCRLLPWKSIETN